MSIFRRRQDQAVAQAAQQDAIGHISANQAVGLEQNTNGIEALEVELQPHLGELSEKWERIYSIYGERVRSGIGQTAIKSEIDDSIRDGVMRPDEGMEWSQRDTRRIKNRLSNKQVGLMLSEAMVSARMRAMGEANPRQYPTYRLDGAIYDEMTSPFESRTQDFDETWLVASDLHQSLFNEFIDIEEHSEPVIQEVELFMRSSDENRVAFIDWLSARDPEISEDRVLLRTLASHYEYDDKALDPTSDTYLFDAGNKPSAFTVGLALLEEGSDGESLRQYTSSLRRILTKYGVDTAALSDADLVTENYDELTPEVQQRLAGLGATLNRDLKDRFTAILSKHRVKTHRIPKPENLAAITQELRADTTKGVAKKRASKGRVTQNQVKDFIITAADLERSAPEYQFAKLVAGGHNGSLNVEALDEQALEKMIERAAHEGGSEIAALRRDITTALRDIRENPYLDGSKKARGANDVRFQLSQTDRTARTAPTRTYAPFRNTSSATHEPKITSQLGKQLRVTYVVAGESVAIEGIFTDHDAYERSLNQ